MDHMRHMHHAIALANRHKGLTGANPSVGCVIVKNDRIIARGSTSIGGRPHAEINALQKAIEKCDGATAYVSLEPCAHEGDTPSCARVLVESGIARVVTAMADPDPRTSGKGHKILKDAGLEVTTGILYNNAQEPISGFLSRLQNQRPYYQLKMGVTRDGKIAISRGIRSQVTGELSKKYSMYLRAKCDAILIGINTAIADDPLLTVRINGIEDRSPIRIILDENGDLPLQSKLVHSAGETPVWLIVDQVKQAQISEKFSATEVEIIGCKTQNNQINLQCLSKLLHNRKIGQVMIEGGARIAAGFAAQGLIDEIALFKSQKIFGKAALEAIEGMSITQLTKKYRKSESFSLGEDSFTLYQRPSKG